MGKKYQKNNFKLFIWWVLLGSITLSINLQQPALIVFIAIGFIYLCFLKWNKKEIIIWTIIVLLVIVMAFCFNEQWNLKTLFKLIEQHLFSLRNSAINYLRNHYDQVAFDFLRLLLLNDKQANYELLNQLTSLNLIHLFVVSGLHISILSLIIELICRRNKKLSMVINQPLILFLFYLSGFSISILRVLINLNVKLILKTKDQLQSNLLTGIIINLLFINEVKTYSYMLSMVATIFICFIVQNIKNKLLCYLLINCLTSLILMPIINLFNDKFNFLAFINNIIFSNIILIIYFLCLIFAWIPFMTHIIGGFINEFLKLLTLFSQSQFIVHVKLPHLIVYLWYFMLLNLASIFSIRKEGYEWLFNAYVLKQINKFKMGQNQVRW